MSMSRAKQDVDRFLSPSGLEVLAGRSARCKSLSCGQIGRLVSVCHRGYLHSVLLNSTPTKLPPGNSTLYIMGSKIPKGVSCWRMLTLWIRTNVVLALIAAGLNVNCCVSANERVSFELTLKDALWSPGRAWWVVQLGIATGQGTLYLFGPKILHYIYIYIIVAYMII